MPKKLLLKNYEIMFHEVLYLVTKGTKLGFKLVSHMDHYFLSCFAFLPEKKFKMKGRTSSESAIQGFY